MLEPALAAVAEQLLEIDIAAPHIRHRTRTSAIFDMNHGVAPRIFEEEEGGIVAGLFCPEQIHFKHHKVRFSF